MGSPKSVQLSANGKGHSGLCSRIPVSPSRAAVGGDLHAFEQLVERHRDVVFRVGARLVASDQEVEDLTQDTFLRAFHRLDRYRGEAPFRSWLLRVAPTTSQSPM